MKQIIEEQLSALMDGELERDQTRFLLKRLESDDGLSLRWARYHVARQSLRRQEVVVLSDDFASRVMARLESETTVQHRHMAPWLRWGAGGAIAASVAVMALVLTRPDGAPSPEPLAAGTVRNAAPQVAAVNVAPVSATTTPANDGFRTPMLVPNQPVDAAPVNFGSDLSQPVGIDPRLQTYFIRHYQTPGGSGQSAMVPYVLLTVPQREAPGAVNDGAVPQNR